MLDNLEKKTNPFRVPENYFENFNMQIMDQLPIKENKKAKIVPLWQKVAPWVAVAAVLCGILIYTGSLFDNNIGASTDSKSTGGYAASTGVTEDDLYDFLEDEVTASIYTDMMYDDVYTN